MCDGQKVAIKRMRSSYWKSALKLKAEASVEVNLLDAFSDDEHFVALYDYASSGSDLFIAMEAATGGTLDRLGYKPTQATKFLLFQDVVEGMQVMKQRNIVHRDLKPANIFISTPCWPSGDCHAKIGDLGLACRVKPKENDQAFEAAVGPDGTNKMDQMLAIPECKRNSIFTAVNPVYLSPEIFLGHRPDYSNDVWALGLMLYELRCGVLPARFMMHEVPTLLKRLWFVTRFNIDAYLPCRAMTDTPEHFDPLIEQVLRGALQVSPSRRMTLEQIQEAILASNEARDIQGQRTKDKVACVPECWVLEHKSRSGACGQHEEDSTSTPTSTSNSTSTDEPEKTEKDKKSGAGIAEDAGGDEIKSEDRGKNFKPAETTAKSTEPQTEPETKNQPEETEHKDVGEESNSAETPGGDSTAEDDGGEEIKSEDGSKNSNSKDGTKS